jgi:pimeloyl-ACP methyl ester carboxylesterase
MTKKIILVHGLSGSPAGTWGKFIELLEKDSDLEHRVLPLGYQSPHFFKRFYEPAPSILNITNGLLTDIENKCDLGKDEIILVGHSLGGLIVKRLLLKLEDKGIAHKIRKVCFFDVPHDGSGLANVGKYIAFRNKHLRSLCRDSSELDEMNERWFESRLDSKFEIISIIAANDFIVSSSSSKSVFRNHQIKTINNVDHSSIVKPAGYDSPSYIVLKNFLLASHPLLRFKNIASRDIKDWKSIERNHSYKYVADNQRNSDLKALIDSLKIKSPIIRLSGASGLGKSRLLIEAFESDDSIKDSDILIFDAADYELKIKESIRSMLDFDTYGIVIIENCTVKLHNELRREIRKKECQLKIITIAYSHDRVEDSIHIQLSTLDNVAIKGILSPILVGMESSDIDRIASFAQGYPLMATLLAQHYKKEQRFLGSPEAIAVVNKLVKGDSDPSESELDVLSACSLFDVFGTNEGSAGDEARFIAETVAGSSIQVFDKVLSRFTAQQIINRAGRYARVVPKPLALTLASKWWEETSYNEQKRIVDSIPESLFQSFCTQASYLDDQPSVQKFTDKLFGSQSPFVQAEELLTERGSKLFRAFVEVNPKSTSDALYRVLCGLTQEQILNIKGQTRRNLVWALEKLCFHATEFSNASWSLLLLASAENENWNNNATGIFCQLFRLQLSGTEAPPSMRFQVLNRAIDANLQNMDMVVLTALEQAVNTHGGSRTVGAEYQGTKAPLEEWKPKLWQEIFDYWEEAFDLLLNFLERGEAQKSRVLAIAGHSIRGFLSNHRIEMLDKAIRKIVSVHGAYWPEALGAIKTIFQYDRESLQPEALLALNGWSELLNPANADLSEKLKIVVIDPPWEHRESENGEYIDVAAENATILAEELASNISEMTRHIELLLKGEQRQTQTFGYVIGLSLDDPQNLVDLTLEKLISLDDPNPSFLLGLYRSIFQKSPELWQLNIDRLLQHERLVIHYPNCICTGKVQESHLNQLLTLIKDNKLSVNAANVLGYGRVTELLDSSEITKFCLQLSALGEEASWTALNVIYMYCFNQKDHAVNLRDTLVELVLAVPLHKGLRLHVTDMHHWHDLAERLLKTNDTQFAIALTMQMIKATERDLDHSNIWNYIKPLLLQLMGDYAHVLWPLFGDAILKANGRQRYWLQQLLDRENSLVSNLPSVLSAVPINQIIQWCSQHPEVGPIFVARCLNIFETAMETRKPSILFVSLLENFGADQRVGAELEANMATRGWSGSLVPYLLDDKKILEPLLAHKNSNVRRWVSDHISNIDDQIFNETQRDAERDLGSG